MKKTITALTMILCLSATAQKKDSSAQKKDTTIQITVSLDNFRSLLYIIDQNIDSKKTSKELMDFLQKSAQIVADKPKEVKPKQ